MAYPNIIAFIIVFCICTALCAQTADSTRITQKDDTLSIEEISVSAYKRKPITTSITGKIRLLPSEMEKIPAILGNTDILKLLELTPGVQTAGDANTSLYVRGGEPGQNLLLLDNIPIYTPGHLLGFFPLFNADHLSSLEMSKSGMNAAYGGRLSSVIDVASKKTIPQRFGLKGNVGLISSQATLNIPLYKNWGAYVSLRKTYLELLMNPVLNATVNSNAKTRVNDLSYGFWDGNLTLIGEINKSNRIQVNAFLGKDELIVNEKDILLDGSINWKNKAFSLQWETKTGERSMLEQLVFYSQYDNELKSSQAQMDIDIFSSVKNMGYKSKYRFFIGNILLESGLHYSFYKITPQQIIMRNTGLSYPSSSFPTTQSHEVSTFISSRMTFFEKLYVDAGLRFNAFNQSKTFFSVEPRLSVSYELKDNHFLRSNFSRQNQYLHLLTTSSVGIPIDFWMASSSEISPQTGNEISAGYSRSFGNDAFELSVDVFYRKMYHLTEYNQNILRNDTEPNWENIFFGNGKAYGLELSFSKNFGKLTGWLSYALGRSERDFKELNDGKTFPARFDRRHDFSLVATYRFNEKWDMSLVQIYATGNAYTVPDSWYFINNTPVKQYGKYNGARMSDYNRTDLSVNFWMKENNGFNLSIYNLFMVYNPVYTFILPSYDDEKGILYVKVKRKNLSTIIPSISWKFKF